MLLDRRPPGLRYGTLIAAGAVPLALAEDTGRSRLSKPRKRLHLRAEHVASASGSDEKGVR
jgi:hypothetical protein